MIWLIGGYIWLYLHRPFEVWPVLAPLHIERVYMIGVLMVWLLHPGKMWASNRLNKALLFFTIAILLCWFGSPLPSYLGEKVVEEHFKVGVLFVLLITVVDDEEKLRKVIGFFVISLFLYEAHSFYEFLCGRYEYRMGTIRMNGINKTHGDPNTFSGMLLYGLPYLAPLWLCARGGKWKPFIVAHILLTLLCIKYSGSRRAYIGIAFLMFIYAWRSPRRWTWLSLMALAAPIVLLTMRQDLHDRLMTIFDSSYGPSNANTSAKFRWQAFLDSIGLFEKHPFTGTGPATFATASGHGLQAHSLYAQTLSEMGGLGVLALIFMVICFWRNTREVERLYREHPWWEKDFVYHIGKTTGVAIVVLLVMGIGGHNLFRFNWLWYAAFQVCALSMARRRAAAELQEVWRYERGWEFAMPQAAWRGVR